jgi:hypothetical protein
VEKKQIERTADCMIFLHRRRKSLCAANMILLFGVYFISQYPAGIVNLLLMAGFNFELNNN